MKAHINALIAVIVCAAVGAGVWFALHREPSATSSEIQRSVQEMPELKLKTIDGVDLDPAAWRGRLVIVNFWASWCAPCIEEVPSLIKLSERMKDRLHILAISGDGEPEDVMIFLKSFPGFRRDGVSIVFDDKLKLMKQFDVVKLPESYIFNSEGRMVRKVSGSIDWASPDAIEYLESLR